MCIGWACVLGPRFFDVLPKPFDLILFGLSITVIVCYPGSLNLQ